MGPKKIGAMGRNFALDFVAWSRLKFRDGVIATGENLRCDEANILRSNKCADIPP